MNFFGFPEQTEVMVTLHCSPLNAQQHYVKKKKNKQTNVHSSIKNTLLLKNANHHLSLQQVRIFIAGGGFEIL